MSDYQSNRLNNADKNRFNLIQLQNNIEAKRRHSFPKTFITKERWHNIITYTTRFQIHLNCFSSYCVPLVRKASILVWWLPLSQGWLVLYRELLLIDIHIALAVLYLCRHLATSVVYGELSWNFELIIVALGSLRVLGLSHLTSLPGGWSVAECFINLNDIVSLFLS